ncbi:MAG TPA: AarF/UbiB family protein [Usitatibacter sp.]|nr:AarF/UbiB family protein [Usitatibacter sp.]
MLIASLERLRALPRLVEITRTLVHFGLHDLLHSVGLHKAVVEVGAILKWVPDPAMPSKPLPERLRLALEALGPAFVKLGQVLASRVDLLGPDWIESLDRLHDQAAPLPFEALRAQLAEDLGAPIDQRFQAFDIHPSAAGSVAQVHRAVLPGGDAVAVKIRRPGVSAAIEADLLLLEALAAWWEEESPDARRFQPVELVRQLRKSLAREVDFAAEARSQARFAQSFAGDPGIVVPRVRVEFTRASLLVMDWVEGMAGTDMDKLEAAGYDRQALAARGADAVLKMVLVDGMFHADPHPGNVLFLPGNRVALIDFGMVGWLSAKRRDELLDLLAGVAERDAEAMRDVLIAWADGRRVSAERFTEDLGRLLHLYEDVSLRELSLGVLLAEIAGIMREHQLVLPADLALLFKALITLEGLGTRLVPRFRLIEHVTPFVQRLVAERWQPSQVAGRMGGAAREWARAMRAAPRVLETLARRFTDDGVAMRFELRELDTFSRQVEQSVNRLSVALLTAALIVGSSILMSVARSEVSAAAWFLGGVGILIAFANSVWLLLSIRRSRRLG